MLGVRIAALRRAAGISQSELAQKLRISPRTVGMDEQGRRDPNVPRVDAKDTIFGVTIDFLVTGKAGSTQEEDHLMQLVAERVNATDTRLNNRRVRPFSREELAVLFAAMLMEP